MSVLTRYWALTRPGADVESLSWWYSIQPDHVDAALEFEEALSR